MVEQKSFTSIRDHEYDNIYIDENHNRAFISIDVCMPDFHSKSDIFSGLFKFVQDNFNQLECFRTSKNELLLNVDCGLEISFKEFKDFVFSYDPLIEKATEINVFYLQKAIVDNASRWVRFYCSFFDFPDYGDDFEIVSD